MLPSLYAQYIMAREGFQIIETEYSFATFQIEKENCYIRDIYVVPEMRNSREASRLADEISDLARVEGCTKLIGSVCPSAKGSTESLKVLMAYGFRLQSASANFIIFEKGL